MADNELTSSTMATFDASHSSVSAEILLTPSTVELTPSISTFIFSTVSLSTLVTSSPMLLTSAALLLAFSACSRRCSISFRISLAVSEDSVARLPISSATTANPLPASPALAASIEALSARRLVWAAILLIPSTFSLTLLTAILVSVIVWLISATALSIMLMLTDNCSRAPADSWEAVLISAAEEANVSAFSATVRMACERSSIL